MTSSYEVQFALTAMNYLDLDIPGGGAAGMDPLEGIRGLTLLQSNFLTSLPAQGPIFKFLSILGYNFFHLFIQGYKNEACFLV